MGLLKCFVFLWILFFCLIIFRILQDNHLGLPFRKIWLYEHADYEKLRQNLFNVNWDSLFLTDDIELITNDITNAILSAAESSLAFLTRLVTSFLIFLNLFQCMELLKCFAFLWILFFCLIIFRILQDNHLGPPFRIVTILLRIEDSIINWSYIDK
jgi:hypothetical protein